MMPMLMIDGQPIAEIDDRSAVALLNLASNGAGHVTRSMSITMNRPELLVPPPWEKSRPRAKQRERWTYDASLELRFVEDR